MYTDSLERPRAQIAVQRELEQQQRFRLEQLEALTQDAGSASGTQLEVTRALRTAANRALDEIDAALSRLEVGTYGVCERCRRGIRADRLDAVPTSRYCTACQVAVESTGATPVRVLRR